MREQRDFPYFLVGVLAVVIGILGYVYLADDTEPVGTLGERQDINRNIEGDGTTGTFEEQPQEGIEP